jgi:hypothetical protein
MWSASLQWTYGSVYSTNLLELRSVFLSIYGIVFDRPWLESIIVLEVPDHVPGTLVDWGIIRLVRMPHTHFPQKFN